ncbi:hypothetical protein PVK06_026456 [Gossypium arboreum]|uniref:Reverse transcriptase n=1 Tax=Gossypium arboreum TaxID=29729 RepID=A0ABR0P0K7_GOSAR|nr:hypothetical protein PVK06_026456 [Gossypium arboreum]
MNGQVGDALWLLGGDFNVTLSPKKSSSFNSYQSFTVDMKDFQALVREIEVFDRAYFVPIFTWSNHQLDRPIAKKLDRVLINATWFLQLVVESWQLTVVGDPMLKLFTKLKRLKPVLNMLNTETFGNIYARVKVKVEELESLQLALLQGDLVRNSHINQVRDDLLVFPITNEEIKATSFGQGNEKVPGLDGFTAFFFKSAWGTVGPDFLEAV